MPLCGWSYAKNIANENKCILVRYGQCCSEIKMDMKLFLWQSRKANVFSAMRCGVWLKVAIIQVVLHISVLMFNVIQWLAAVLLY